MRFRLATGGQGGQQLVGGVGNFFRSLAMAPLYEAQATEDRQKSESELAYRAAQQRQADATASLYAAKARQEQDVTDRRSLGNTIADAATLHGVPTDFLPDLEHRIKTGALPSQYQTPSDGMGPVAPVPPALSPENVTRVMRDIGLTNRTFAIDRGNVKDIADASGQYRDQGLGDAVLAGQRPAGQVGQAQAAMHGRPLVDNIGDSGAGFNQFTGEGVALIPVMQTIFGNKANAQIGADQARAGASKAAAGASGALAGLRGVQTKNQKQIGEMNAIDLAAMAEGKARPSKARDSHGADSTDAKFFNATKAKMLADPEWSHATDEEFVFELNRRVNLGKKNADQAAGAEPVKAPQGMKVVGRTPDGKIVYEDKNGKRFTN
jgi:hypothetical protein